MNGFDLVVMVIVLFCLVRGAFKGLIREVAGIVAVMAGFYGAITYYPLPAPFLAGFIETDSIRYLISFGVLFVGIVVLVNLLAAIIRKLLQLVFLGWVDRTFGLIFGTAKGLLIVSVAFILLTALAPSGTGFLTESKTAPYLSRISQTMTLFVSQNLRSELMDHLKGLQDTWKI